MAQNTDGFDAFLKVIEQAKNETDSPERKAQVQEIGDFVMQAMRQFGIKDVAFADDEESTRKVVEDAITETAAFKEAEAAAIRAAAPKRKARKTGKRSMANGKKAE